MLEEWSAAGYPPDQFWHQTPRTYMAVMRGHFEREKRAHRNAAWLASTTGALAQIRPKDHPSIPRLAGEPEPPPPVMDDNQILASMNAWVSVTQRK